MKRNTQTKNGRMAIVAALCFAIASFHQVANAAISGSSTTVLVVINSFLDADQDGLLDTVETSLNTNPSIDDTDNDGMDDEYEVWNGLDPINASDARVDVDGDTLSNVDEYTVGSMPFSVDSDGDGFWDNIESQRGTNPSDDNDKPLRAIAADVDVDGSVNAIDVQMVINGALGMTVQVPVNVDNAGGVNALDVQQVINAAVL
jgi:hypothetical protein